MKPGSWLEVSNFSQVGLKTILSFGNIDFLLLEESHQAIPDFPFILILRNPDQILNSIWAHSDFCQGFLLRSENLEVFNDSFKTVRQKPVWIEILVYDYKKAAQSIRNLSSWKCNGYFLTPSENFSSSKFNKLIADFKLSPLPRPHDLPVSYFESWSELEDFKSPLYEKTYTQSPKISFIIPHFESPHFLCNVLSHLDQVARFSEIEVLVVDDHSSNSALNQILYFANRRLNRLNIRIFKWDKAATLPNGKKLFRAGASRNWGAHESRSENLFFLDSDMLVPDSIAETALTLLRNYDVIQFVRKHIPQIYSHEVTQYSQMVQSNELYVEESSYWKPFFDCSAWDNLDDYWKYTCTYGLALKKAKFFECGRLRRNFIQYGFEDTDLGYRLDKIGARFHLAKTPLLHLTQKKDSSQGVLYKIQKLNRIRPMAKIFHRLNPESGLYWKFQSLLD